MAKVDLLSGKPPFHQGYALWGSGRCQWLSMVFKNKEDPAYVDVRIENGWYETYTPDGKHRDLEGDWGYIGNPDGSYRPMKKPPEPTPDAWDIIAFVPGAYDLAGAGLYQNTPQLAQWIREQASQPS